MFGLRFNLRFIVVVTMKIESILNVCPNSNLSLIAHDNIGFRFHWIKEFYLIDVVLICESDDRFGRVLYRMVFRSMRARR